MFLINFIDFLLQTTANLFPEVPKLGFGAEEKDRMINNISERVEEKVADCKETKSLIAATEQVKMLKILKKSRFLSENLSKITKNRYLSLFSSKNQYFIVFSR